jgi:choline dehydrogenase-like flavoprotein
MADFDYVIVGAGTTGCVLASRLSEDPGNRVLVLEYGGHYTNPMLYVPEGSISRCGAAAIATITRPGRSVPEARSPATPRPRRWRSPGSPPTSSSKTPK